MNTIIRFDRLFVFSEYYNSCFYEDFSPNVNIISGRNTSGKSSLMQSILFSFGINDVKEGLHEILEYKPIFRLDLTKLEGDLNDNYIIIRDSNSIYIKESNGKVVSFHGIDANNSVEHVRLKNYISSIVGFSLSLEQKGELKSAPLESMFLPYYISQSVGWVYLRDSFSNLQFYKNFKDEYLDYYLGINNNFDRELQYDLIKKKNELIFDIKNLKRYSAGSEFQLSVLIDESLGSQASSYVEGYISELNSLEDERNSYIKLCNERSLMQNHYKIIKKTKSNIQKQKYNNIDRCPSCTQILLYSLEGLYSHYQKYNDTNELELHVKERLVNVSSKINSSNNKIKAINENISSTYSVLSNSKLGEVTFEQWVINKANSDLYKKMVVDIGLLEEELIEVNSSLSSLVTDESTIHNRNLRNNDFSTIFKEYSSLLKLQPLTDSRYTKLYEIQSFPRQGVELHKTVMAYHFALNAMIKKYKVAHRLPFLLDAILKEDIDETNLKIILSFVGSNLPSDTQTFISISEHINDSVNEINVDEKPIEKISVKEVLKKYFPVNSKLMYIGNGLKERSFLSQSLDEHQDMYLETINIVAI